MSLTALNPSRSSRSSIPSRPLRRGGLLANELAAEAAAVEQPGQLVVVGELALECLASRR